MNFTQSINHEDAEFKKCFSDDFMIDLLKSGGDQKTIDHYAKDVIPPLAHRMAIDYVARNLEISQRKKIDAFRDDALKAVLESVKTENQALKRGIEDCFEDWFNWRAHELLTPTNLKGRKLPEGVAPRYAKVPDLKAEAVKVFTQRVEAAAKMQKTVNEDLNWFLRTLKGELLKEDDEAKRVKEKIEVEVSVLVARARFKIISGETKVSVDKKELWNKIRNNLAGRFPDLPEAYEQTAIEKFGQSLSSAASTVSGLFSRVAGLFSKKK